MGAIDLGMSPEMRLWDADGRRLYLTADERTRFLAAAAHEDREDRIFCNVLHYSGCRPSEAAELTPRRIQIAENELVFRTLKKRAKDRQGRKKQPQYRAVPVPSRLIEELDLVFDLRRRRRSNSDLDVLLWPQDRTTLWRMVKRVMARADIGGPQATSKGLRHGFGIAMLASAKPVPLNILRDLMGHADTKTTEIYLQAIGIEKREMVMQASDIR
jgi:integrase